MKRFKKLASFILAAAMVLTMGLTAFADPITHAKNTIQIQKASEKLSAQGTQYSLYKVAEKTYDDDGNSSWEVCEQFRSVLDLETWNRLTSKVVNSSEGRVLSPDVPEIQQIAFNLENLMRDSNGTIKPEYTAVDTATVGADETATFSNVAEGYYLILETKTPETVKIISSLPMLVFVNYDPKIDGAEPGDDEKTYKVTAKTDEPSVTKVIEKNDTDYATSTEDVGDTVHYRLDAEVPVYSSDMFDVVFTLNDTAAKGLDIQEETIHVYGVDADGKPTEIHSPGAFDVIEVSGDVKTGEKFSVAFKYDQLIDGSGTRYQYVSVKYDAVLTEDCVIEVFDEESNKVTSPQGNKNQVQLEYSTNYDVVAKSTPKEVTTYTYQFPIFKYEVLADGTEAHKALGGARFVVYKTVDGKKEFVNLWGTEKEGAKTKVDETEVRDKFEEKDDVEGETYFELSDGTQVDAKYAFTSGDNGYIYLYGLDAGTYTVEEVKAPDGYTKAANVESFTIGTTDNGETTIEIRSDKIESVGSNTTVGPKDASRSANQIEVVNSKDITLPTTGGIGTTIFYVLGALLVVIAGVVLVTRRRMNGK